VENFDTKELAIDFKQFKEIIGVSCMGFEVVQVLKSPFQSLIGRKSIYFQVKNLEAEN
jgi:hypothetical protein